MDFFFWLLKENQLEFFFKNPKISMNNLKFGEKHHHQNG